MTNPQNYVAVPVAAHVEWTKTVPVDTIIETGVQSESEMRQMSLSRAEAWFIHMMRKARMTGKCATLVARWDRQAWHFQDCNPPVRLNEV